MGLGKQESTTSVEIPGMSPTARRIQRLLAQQAQAAAGQMGGPISTEATPEQLAYIQQIQEATGETARGQMEQGLRESMGQVEAGALERGVEGSSIEQVLQALNAQDFQRQLNEMLQRQRAEAGQMAINTGFANADVQLNRNQQLLQQLIGASSPIIQADVAARTAQPTQTNTQTDSPFGQLLQLGIMAGGMALGGPAGGAAAGALTQDQFEKMIYDARGYGPGPRQ